MESRNFEISRFYSCDEQQRKWNDKDTLDPVKCRLRKRSRIKLYSSRSINETIMSCCYMSLDHRRESNDELSPRWINARLHFTIQRTSLQWKLRTTLYNRLSNNSSPIARKKKYLTLDYAFQIAFMTLSLAFFEFRKIRLIRCTRQIVRFFRILEILIILVL